MAGSRHQQRRRRRRADRGGIAWLVDQVTGDLADAVTRDLITDRLTLDTLLDNFGMRGLWAYVTTAPRGTAIYDTRCEGWYIADHLAAEQLDVDRKLYWRYGAVHFKDGDKIPFPESIARPGVEPIDSAATWEEALEDPAPPQVVAMLKGA